MRKILFLRSLYIKNMKEQLRYVLKNYIWLVCIGILLVMGISIYAINSIEGSNVSQLTRRISMAENIREIVSVGYIRNGYLSAGLLSNSGQAGDVIILAKSDKLGKVEWEREYNLGGKAEFQNVYHMPDQSIFLVGSLMPAGGNLYNGIVYKFSPDGKMLWKKMFPHYFKNHISAIQPSGDGGFYCAGNTRVTGDGNQEAWIFKLDAQGDKNWEKVIGDRGIDESSNLITNSDGTFLMAGSRTDKDTGIWNAWLVKFNKQGDTLWEKTYFPGEISESYSLKSCPDGGYLVMGGCKSLRPGMRNLLVFKVDNEGQVVWKKKPQLPDFENLKAAYSSEDGSFLLACNSQNRILLLSMDLNGVIKGEKIISPWGINVLEGIQDYTRSNATLLCKSSRFFSRNQIFSMEIPISR